MQQLNQLMQIAKAASIVNDLTRSKHTHSLPARDALTVYLHAQDAAVRLVRWDRPLVEATIETRPPLAWRVATDFDDDGVYIVALRRAGFGSIASASMQVLVPRRAHLVLRLTDGLVTLDHVTGTLHIPPPADDDPALLPPPEAD